MKGNAENISTVLKKFSSANELPNVICAPPNSIEQKMSKFRHSQKWLLEKTNCSASNAGKLASEKLFSSQKHMEEDFPLLLSWNSDKKSGGAQILYAKTSKLSWRMSNTALLSKNIALSEIKFEKDGFTFPGSTEHLMPIYLSHIWKQVSFYWFTQKGNFWTGCVSAMKMNLHLPNQRLMQRPEKLFWKEFHVSFTSLKSIKFFQTDVLPWIGIEKDSLHIKTQLLIWCNCFGERKNSTCYEIFFRRINLRDSFLHFSFQFPPQKIVAWKAVLSKVHDRRLDLCWWATETAKKILSKKILVSNTRAMENKWFAGLGEPISCFKEM